MLFLENRGSSKSTVSVFEGVSTCLYFSALIIFPTLKIVYKLIHNLTMFRNNHSVRPIKTQKHGIVPSSHCKIYPGVIFWITCLFKLAIWDHRGSPLERGCFNEKSGWQLSYFYFRGCLYPWVTASVTCHSANTRKYYLWITTKTNVSYFNKLFS